MDDSFKLQLPRFPKLYRVVVPGFQKRYLRAEEPFKKKHQDPEKISKHKGKNRTRNYNQMLVENESF